MVKLPQITSVFGEKSNDVFEYRNFVVATFKDKNAIRIDVTRKDLIDGITWDELMMIKDIAGFGDKDAVEFYPANDAVINTGNIRHLYVFDEHLDLIKRC